MPRYLEKAKFVAYLLFLAGTVMITASCIVSGYYLLPYLSGLSFRQLFGETDFMRILANQALPSTVASATLAMSIKLAKNWISAKKRQQLLEKEKVETELKFLKSQFNPHFLFNTINSIFVLIHKNPDMASEALAKFSDLLRYQLYECNEQKIPLAKEVDYLRNFIELGRLRLEQSVHVSVVFDDFRISEFKIAPFVLMPFVENAFKYVSQGNGVRNWLEIQVSGSGSGIILSVVNSVSDMSVSESKVLGQNKGIGLKNVKRRLNLVYFERHVLKLERTDTEFRVHLYIDLAAERESVKTLNSQLVPFTS